MKMRFIFVLTVSMCAFGPRGEEREEKREDGGIEDCSGTNVAGTVHELAVDGKARCFTLYTPSGVTKPMPVMVFFHGGGSRASAQCSQRAEFVQDADSLGYALVCADSYVDWQFPAIDGESGVNSDNPQPCTSADNVEADYVKGIFEVLEADPNHYDAEKIYFVGWSQGAMMTAWASTCFADKIRGVVQAGSGLKINGAAVTSEWCASSSSNRCQAGVTDGVDIPNGGGSCDTCEYFPIQPAKLNNVVGEPLRWCIYAGCSDYLLDSIINMANYQRDLGSPYNVEYYAGSHIAPQQWMSKIASCHGIWTGTPQTNDGVTCDTMESSESGQNNVDHPTQGGGQGGNQRGLQGGGQVGRNRTIPSCSESGKTTRCCGDGTCDGPENGGNCAADCTGGAQGDDQGGDQGGGREGDEIREEFWSRFNCSANRTSDCCGDGSCGGIETWRNCAADCTEGEVVLRNCSRLRTTRCCGDAQCGGPENVTNCAADCTGNTDNTDNTGDTSNTGNTGIGNQNEGAQSPSGNQEAEGNPDVSVAAASGITAIKFLSYSMMMLTQITYASLWVQLVV